MSIKATLKLFAPTKTNELFKANEILQEFHNKDRDLRRWYLTDCFYDEEHQGFRYEFEEHKKVEV